MSPFRNVPPSRRHLVAASFVLVGSSACGGTAATVEDASATDAARHDAIAREEASISEDDSGEKATPRSDAKSCTGAVTTAGVECTYSHDAYNSSASVKANSTVAWSCSSTERTVTGNGIPDHAAGTFPNANCPNTITEQTISATMTLTPVAATSDTTLHIVGYAFNGVKFDPSTAGACTNVDGGSATCSLLTVSGNWNIEALGQTSFNFGVDSNNAHVQPTGWYHYHGMPNGFLAELGKGEVMTLVGFALDGFPVYARYGYSNATDASSGVKVMTGSYPLKTTPDPGRPSVETYPLGAFTQDYEYVAGSGDLDECNGRTGVTPEFPCGTYHYYITDTYPFIQRCVKGTPSGGNEAAPDDGGVTRTGPPGDGGVMGPPADGGPPR